VLPTLGQRGCWISEEDGFRRSFYVVASGSDPASGISSDRGGSVQAVVDFDVTLFGSLDERMSIYCLASSTIKSIQPA